MKYRNVILITLLLLSLPATAMSSNLDEIIKGVVKHADTGESIPGVHVQSDHGKSGTVTDSNGLFELKIGEADGYLTVSHIGFSGKRISLSEVCGCHGKLEITLIPEEFRGGELLITADRIQMQNSGIYGSSKTRSVEDHMSGISGVDMVSRANMAKDPVIRGLRDGRVNVLIDGMRLTPACVDGMDPATAYVETDNLQAIEIGRGFENGTGKQTAPGGSVNFSMVRPSLNSGFRASAETGYQSVSRQQFYQGSLSHGEENWAFRLSGTFRDAGDLQPGGGGRIDGSGFRKGNVMASVLYEASPSHRFNLRYIGDFAGKIGYPSMIMDTRRADAHIGGLEHAWSNPFTGVHSITTNLYVNRVEHWMDDYDRNVGEREVMRNMYMPMYGETVTSGFSSELSASRSDHLFNLSLEGFRIDAFADMLMEHIDPSVRDMYLVNLGDVVQQNLILSGSHTWFAGSGWTFATNIRGEAGMNRLNNESARATYRAEYHGEIELVPSSLAYQVGIKAENEISSRISAGFSLSSGTRIPDHIERYGYYIYQPLDGFFYIGNPELTPERSIQAELFSRLGSDQSRVSGSLTLWVNKMDNYIAGMRTDDLFKRMQNMGRATLTGFEADASARLSDRWRGSGSISYVLGTHLELDEPLPMMPPLRGNMSLQRVSDSVQLEGRFRWAASQNRIAEENSLETETGGYALLDVFAQVPLNRSVTMRIGMENMLNTFYTEHLSVNSMPAPGRNVNLSVRINL